jgi:hypothetical protein
MTAETNRKTAVAVVPFRTIAHFYDTDDPTPENARELSDRAEESIGHAVLHVPKGHHTEICDELEIRLPASDLTPERQAAIVSATRSHFRNQADEIDDRAHLTIRTGMREIRLTVAVCIPSFIGIAICSQFKGNPLNEVIENILIIISWVMIWQPTQSLVFDRWSERIKAKIYRKIAEMPITVSMV